MTDIERGIRNLFALVAVVALALVFFLKRERAPEGGAGWEEAASAASSLARAERARADSLEAVADSLAAVADSLAAVAVVKKARVAEWIPPPAPDTCLPYTAPRDSILALSREEAAEWQAAYEHEQRAAVGLRTANAGLRLANDSLSAVIDRRPTRAPWWRPTIGVGPTVGVCTDGKPCAAIGASLTWRVR